MKLQAANVASTAVAEEGMIEMPRYKSHKTVWALEIASIEEAGFDSTTDENRMIVVHFVDSRFAPKLINLYGKPTPQAGWYMVAYKDDYISFSPKQQFEEGNAPELSEDSSTIPVKMDDLIALSHRVISHAPELEISPDAVIPSAIKVIDSIRNGDDSKPQFTGIGWAVKQMQNGSKVRRAGWNGKGMFVFLVPGSQFKVSRAPLLGIYPEGTEITYRPHIDLKGADGSIGTWAPSNGDTLATDWEIAD